MIIFICVLLCFYSIKTVQSCGENITWPFNSEMPGHDFQYLSGNFFSDNYNTSGNYLPNTDCKWTLTAPPGVNITIETVDLDLEHFEIQNSDMVSCVDKLILSIPPWTDFLLLNSFGSQVFSVCALTPIIPNVFSTFDVSLNLIWAIRCHFCWVARWKIITIWKRITRKNIII